MDSKTVEPMMILEPMIIQWRLARLAWRLAIVIVLDYLCLGCILGSHKHFYDMLNKVIVPAFA